MIAARAARTGPRFGRRHTHSRLELFQYTACRLLALEPGKFVSASVRRLRANAARAIIHQGPLFRPVSRVSHNIPASLPAPSPLPLTTGGQLGVQERGARSRRSRLRILTSHQSSHFPSVARVRGRGHARPHLHAAPACFARVRISVRLRRRSHPLRTHRPPIRTVRAAPRPLCTDAA